MPLLPERDDVHHYGNAVPLTKDIHDPLHSLYGFVMNMQLVNRKQITRKDSLMSQREGLSHQSIFEYKRPSDAYDTPSIQSIGPSKMPSVSETGLL